MDPITRQAIAAAGGAGGSSATYVDDVFSTFLLEGNGSTQTVVNGIDLSGEGGLVWSKGRDASDQNALFDTERGTLKTIISNSSTTESTYSNRLTAYNSNGFTVGGSGLTNENNKSYVSWTFRKAPGFFDVVTYTGNGTAGRQIAHNLGSVPGMILIKNIDESYDWSVYHRSLANTQYMRLNNSEVAESYNNYWNNTTATSTHFTLGNHGSVNYNGSNLVAYVFAHDNQSFGTNEDEAIIKCGSYTGSGSSGNFVNVGFEPQFILIKNTSTSSTNWMMLDVMRGLPAQSGSTAKRLFANTNAAEGLNNSIEPSATGFTPTGSGSYTNQSSDTYIYMAIRRPHKPPTSGTEVFTAAYSNGGSYPSFNTNGHVVDFGIYRRPSTTENWYTTNRLTAPYYLFTNTSGTESSSGINYDYQDGFADSASSDYFAYMFRRAPGVMDVVAYLGNGSATRQISHNLEATPELIIVKSRSNTSQWLVWNTTFGHGTTENYILLNGSSPRGGSTPPIFTTSAPTSSYFNVSYDSGLNVQFTTNASSYTYTALLFASLSGISKVGTYSGTGYSVNVDCGFTAGARFVLIKRTDSSGDWYVWDSTRGIVSGNDPYWLFNSNAVQVTNTDYIDPLNAGFTVTSSAPAALNASGGTYLFLAIA